MKRLLTASLFLSLGGGAAIAQITVNPVKEVTTTNSLGQTVTTSTASSFMITLPMSQWEDADLNEEKEEKEIRNNFEREAYLNSLTNNEADPVVQTNEGSRISRAPIVNFAGQTGSGYPPDPSGAAGPNHYVQAVNTTYRVFDKTGNALTTTKNLSTLWPGSSNTGDPIVMYDRHADRWFISQFNDPAKILIAISTTSDPTGTYYAYTFNLTEFPDYPKYSIWWDGYYMTSNSVHTAVVFERAAMLAGSATPQMVSLTLPSLNSGGFRSPLPADADGPLPPDGTPCYFFNLEDNQFGVPQDQIEIYEMTTNWVTPGSSQVVSSQQLPVASFDAVFTGGFANIAQPGTNQKLDAIQGVLMYRAQHMRWSGYNTIVLSHAVDLGSNRSGVRWYELRDANDGNWTVFQQGTYSPGATMNRWMSSAAMDNYGNIGMAYSYCDPSNTIYPGLAYTGRLATDAPGQMTFNEEIAIDGLGSQTSIDRYGDYAHLSLDPDGETFWHTGEYLTTNGGKKTRIFSFNLQAQVGLDENPYYTNLNMTLTTGASEIAVKLEGIYDENQVSIDLIGMDGRVIASTQQTPSGKTVAHTFNNLKLNDGIYFVRIGNKNYQKATRFLYSH